MVGRAARVHGAEAFFRDRPLSADGYLSPASGRAGAPGWTASASWAPVRNRCRLGLALDEMAIR
jgi:hypothetical protein